MKTVFDKTNEQCQVRLSIAVARKRGLKAKLILLGAMICALVMMTACKNETTGEAAAHGGMDIPSEDSRIFGIVEYDDTLLVVCDPDGLFFGCTLAECVSTEWIKETFPAPNFNIMTDRELFPHEGGSCTCGQEFIWVIGKNDTLWFSRADDENVEKVPDVWKYICGKIHDTIIVFGGYRVGMTVENVARRLHLSDTINIHNYKVIHLVAPDLFNEPIWEHFEGGGRKCIGQYNPYEYQYFDTSRINYAGVKILIEKGKVQSLITGYYMSNYREIEWGI